MTAPCPCLDANGPPKADADFTEGGHCRFRTGETNNSQIRCPKPALLAKRAATAESIRALRARSAIA